MTCCLIHAHQHGARGEGCGTRRSAGGRTFSIRQGAPGATSSYMLLLTVATCGPYHVENWDPLRETRNTPELSALKLLILPPENYTSPTGKPLLPAQWSEISTMTISYGHGLSVTPLHLAAGYATLANGGIKVTPTLLHDANRAPGERVVSEQTAAATRAMLRAVVSRGTASLGVKLQVVKTARNGDCFFDSLCKAFSHGEARPFRNPQMWRDAAPLLDHSSGSGSGQRCASAIL